MKNSPTTDDIARRKERAALLSIFASILLTLGKLVAGLLSGSLALLSEAGHSLLDVGATALTYYAIKLANRPADDEHHYGHGKVEAVAALCETGLLLALAVGVVIEAFRRLSGTEAAQVDATWVTFGVLGAAIVIDFFRWRSLRKIARETRSDALAADALHFSSDLMGSVLVVCGLAAARAGFQQGDALAAIGVSFFVAIAGYRLGRQTIDNLVDTAPKGLADRIRHLVAMTPGVVDVESIRLRPVGPQVVGEISIAVPRTLPLERVPAIKDAIVAALAAEIPEASVTITANPRALDDETVIERVLLIAARRRLPVHNLTIQEIDGAKSVSLDLEIDGRWLLARAHEAASELEAAIRQELGPGIEVDTHIEPLIAGELSGSDADAETLAAIEASLVRHAADGGQLGDVHKVRVRVNPTGLIVNYHCRGAATLTIEQAHAAVDVIDLKTRADFPNINRIIGHAEPRQA